MRNRFVVADDATFIREILAQIITKLGGEVVGEASNGEEAVEVVLEKKPDVIIMDIVMPQKSGIQATQEILVKLPQARIFACSTEGSENMIMRALEAGCIDFIIKPFKMDDVKARLTKAMAD